MPWSSSEHYLSFVSLDFPLLKVESEKNDRVAGSAEKSEILERAPSPET